MATVAVRPTLIRSALSVDTRYIIAGVLAACLILSAGLDVILLLLSLTILLVAIWTTKQQAGGYVITPAALFLLFFIVFTYIGGIQLFFSNGNSTVYTGGIRNWAFYITMHLGLIGILIGNVAASIGAGFKPGPELAKFRNKPWTDDHNEAADHIVIVFAGLAALTITMIYISNRGVMPLFEILSQQGNRNVYDLAFEARAQYSRYGAGANSYFYQGYFLQFYVVIFPFVVMFYASKFLHYRSAILKWAWIVGSIIACLLLAMSLQRWPLMFFIILNYIVYSSYKSTIRSRETFAFAALAIILFGLLTYIRGIEDFEMVVAWVMDRIIFTQVEVFYSIVEMFPKHFDFLGGLALLGDFKGVLPGPDTSFNSWLFDEYYRAYGSGTAPTVFFGQLYADMGFAGVLSGGILGGFIMQWIYIKHIRGKKRLMNLVVFSFITMACGELAVTVPVVVLFQFGIVTVLLFILLHEVARNILNTSIKMRLYTQGRKVRL